MLMDGKKKLEMYKNAQSIQSNWEGILHEAYSYILPSRANFDKNNAGSVRSQRIFNGTPTESAKMFANNIQSILIPPGRNWASFTTGSSFEQIQNQMSQGQKTEVLKQLESATRVFFKYLQESNFDQVVNSALQDMSISTGVILINEGNQDKPFNFTSIPMDELTIESDPRDGRVVNFWRNWKVKYSAIQKLWPDAVLTDDLKRGIQNSPDEKICIIEGTIQHSDDSIEYYVQTEDGKDIYQIERDYNPWIAFRWNVRTGETLGWGIGLEKLPDIKVLNTISELELKAANLKAYPPFIGITSMSWNVNLARVEPASIIKVGPEFIDKDPIRPIPTNGDPQFSQLLLERIETGIRDAFFANPLPPMNQSPQMTATEVAARQQDWIRSSGTAISRLIVELLDPLVKNCVHILKKFGLLGDIKLDGKLADISYQSPLIELQGQEDFQRFNQFIEFFGQFGNPAIALGVINLPEMPGIVAEQLGVDKRLVASPDQIAELVQKLSGAAQQGAGNIPTGPLQGNPAMPQLGGS